MGTKLPKNLRLGFIELQRLSSLPIGLMRCYCDEPDHAGFTIWSNCSESSGDEAVLYVQMYRLPEAREEFDDDVDLQRKKKAWGRRDSSVLALASVPKSWEHRAVRISPDRMLHVYQDDRLALLMRYTQPGGDDLDDPLFELANQNIKIVASQWKAEPPFDEYEAPEEEPAAAPEPNPFAAGEPAILDLRDDRAAIEAALHAALKAFAAKQADRRSSVHQLPVTGIGLTFDVGNGSVLIDLDVRKPHRPDGSSSHQGFSVLGRPRWRFFCDWVLDGHRGKVVMPNGKSISAKGEDGPDLDRAIGQMCVEILLGLREQKDALGLLTARQCELGVEAPEGDFGWPAYKDRKKENLL